MTHTRVFGLIAVCSGESCLLERDGAQYYEVGGDIVGGVRGQGVGLRIGAGLAICSLRM